VKLWVLSPPISNVSVVCPSCDGSNFLIRCERSLMAYKINYDCNFCISWQLTNVGGTGEDPKTINSKPRTWVYNSKKKIKTLKKKFEKSGSAGLPVVVICSVFRCFLSFARFELGHQTQQKLQQHKKSNKSRRALGEILKNLNQLNRISFKMLFEDLNSLIY